MREDLSRIVEIAKLNLPLKTYQVEYLAEHYEGEITRSGIDAFIRSEEENQAKTEQLQALYKVLFDFSDPHAIQETWTVFRGVVNQSDKVPSKGLLTFLRTRTGDNSFTLSQGQLKSLKIILTGNLGLENLSPLDFGGSGW